jgi:hypothetical protein
MRRRTLMVSLAATPMFAGAQQSIPIRQVGPAEAVAKEAISVAAHVRPLSNGRVIVAHRRRVLLFDSTLQSFKRVADSSSLTAGRTPPFQIPIVPYTRDSTLIVDRNASSFLLVDPNGVIVGAIAAPRAIDIEHFGVVSSSRGYVDERGRLIYRGGFPRTDLPVPRSGVPLLQRDSFPIVRADFATRTVDTLGIVRIPDARVSGSTTDANGRIVRHTTYKPLPAIDAWAALPDGSIAVIRGTDYHIDWTAATGTKTSTPKMPFDWRKLSDEDKTRIVDSVTAIESERARELDSLMRRSVPSYAGETFSVAKPSELPDYYPPVRENGVLADLVGNVWVLPTTSLSARGGPLYDVVNRGGQIFERVQMPPGCALGAVAQRDVVFLVCDGTRLERRRILR